MLFHEVGCRLACVTLLLLMLAGVLNAPARRVTATPRQLPGDSLRDLAPPAPGSSHLSVSAWNEREDEAVISRSENEEDEDEPCSEACPPADGHDLSLAASRITPARAPSVAGLSSVPRPLRC